MSTFSENERFEFLSHSFIYVAPNSSSSKALFLIKMGEEIVREFDITGHFLGLKANESTVMFGLSAFPEGSEKIDLDFATRPQSSGFEINLDANGAITGIGTIDIRDLSRVHHFGIGIEPINIWFDVHTGWFVVEMRDRDTQQTDEADWYVEELIS